MPIELNALETARFGITCARLNGNSSLEEVNNVAAAAGVRMISTRVAVDAFERIHALEADGYRLMDTLVYYGHNELEDASLAPTPNTVSLRAATPDDIAAVEIVARAAFAGYFGHYHADPKLESQAADAAYVEWAANSIRSVSSATPALVAVAHEQIVGFLTLRENSTTEMEVVLNGVHPSHQRGGTYTKLMSEALRDAAERGMDRLIVSTQINNYPVQKVWSRLGMTHQASYYTFHKWFD